MGYVVFAVVRYDTWYTGIWFCFIDCFRFLVLFLETKHILKKTLTDLYYSLLDIFCNLKKLKNGIGN